MNWTKYLLERRKALNCKVPTDASEVRLLIDRIDELTDALAILGRYHAGDGSIRRYKVFDALAAIEKEVPK